MTWSLWTFDTITGTKLARMPHLAGPSWKTALAAPQTGSHAFPLHAPLGYSRDDWRYLTRPWAVSVAWCWDDVPKYSGPILRRTRDYDTGILTIDHTEIRSIFTRRFTWGVNGYESGSVLEVANRAPEGIIRAIVERGALAGAAPGHPWRLPFNLPPDTPGTLGLKSEKWRFKTIEDLLTEVQKVEGGPDIHFNSVTTSPTTFGWDVRVGTPYLPGADLDLNVTAARSGATGVRTVENGVDMLTGVFSLGEGTGEDTPVGFVGTLTGFTTPILDKKVPAKRVGETDLLEETAKGELGRNRLPRKQFSLNVVATEFDFASFTLGARPRVGFFQDWFEPDGWAPAYVIGMSGSDSAVITLDLQETV